MSLMQEAGTIEETRNVPFPYLVNNNINLDIIRNVIIDTHFCKSYQDHMHHQSSQKEVVAPFPTVHLTASERISFESRIPLQI